jgi:hypothetical protein
MNTSNRCAWRIAALLFLGGQGSLALAQFTVSATAGYTEGHFRQAQVAEMQSFTPTVAYAGADWSARLSTPHHQVRGPANVIVGLGRVERGIRTYGKESGFGDPQLEFSYTLRAADDRSSGHEIALECKPGMIDPGRLGSGRTDVGVRWGTYRAWRDMSVFLHLGFRSLGNPGGWDLRNYIHGTIGWKKAATRDTSVGFAYTGSSKTSHQTTPQGQIMAFASRHFGAYECQASLLGGASRSSPSFGAMFTLSLGL